MASVPYSSNIPRTAFVKDVKAQGTQGGTFTSGSWQTRDLNTLEGDNTIVSVSGNQFTLGAGTYIIEASAPALGVIGHKCRLWNVTDSDIEITGSSEYSRVGDYPQTRSFLESIITINAAKVFEIQHICSFTSSTTSGLGFANNFTGTDEVYTIVKITKISN
ncbi:MAG: hypothetical protein Kapaf2KO_01600 [Candidatus Kapaibacteriales bacterium]